MRAALTVILILAWASSPASAQTSPSPPKAPAPAASPSTQPGAATKTPAGKEPTNEALTSCLAQWEKSTHMSKQEWGRACRRVADRLQNLSVK